MSTSAKPASMRILRHLSGPPVTLLPGLARPIVHIRSALPAECERRGKKGGNAGQVCGGSGGAPRHGEKCKRRDKKGGKQRGGGRWNGTEQGGERKGWMTPRHGDEREEGRKGKGLGVGSTGGAAGSEAAVNERQRTRRITHHHRQHQRRHSVPSPELALTHAQSNHAPLP